MPGNCFCICVDVLLGCSVFVTSVFGFSRPQVLLFNISPQFTRVSLMLGAGEGPVSGHHPGCSGRVRGGTL